MALTQKKAWVGIGEVASTKVALTQKKSPDENGRTAFYKSGLNTEKITRMRMGELPFKKGALTQKKKPGWKWEN